MRWYGTWVEAGVCLGWLFMAVGCGDRAGSIDTRPSSDTLSMAALSTHARYVQMRGASEIPPFQEIPRSCWAKEIRGLHPLRVCLHRANLVVVQKESDGVEEGKYISTIISSYAPRSGDDDFTFTNHEGSVCDFKRSVPN